VHVGVAEFNTSSSGGGIPSSKVITAANTTSTRFPAGLESMNGDVKAKLQELASVLMSDLQGKKNRKTCQYSKTGRVIYDEFFPRLSKSIIDEIDTVLAQHYGFTPEELDFIINYDIKYRMGQDNGDGDAEES
jgi:hypothetical protein